MAGEAGGDGVGLGLADWKPGVKSWRNGSELGGRTKLDAWAGRVEGLGLHDSADCSTAPNFGGMDRILSASS